jgi:hypothetical protein
MVLPGPLKSFADWSLREIQITLGALQDKGPKRFLRPIVVAGMMLLAAYMLLYRPPQAKSDRLAAQILAAKNLYDYGERYKQMRSSLEGAYGRLPAVADREQWLSNSVRGLLDKEGISADSITPIQEIEANGLIFQKSTIAANIRFAEFYDLLLRIENARPLMHVEKASVMKVAATGGADNTQSIGYCTTSYEISTVIPKKRF